MKNTLKKVKVVETKGGTKEQKKFNRLSKQIENLRKKIPNETKKLEDALKYYHENVSPLMEDTANEYFKLVNLIEDSTDKYKYTNRQTESIKTVITYLLLECVFPFVDEISQEMKDVYDRWNLISYDEQTDEAMDEMTSFMSEKFKEEFNIDIDFSDLDPNDPESLAKFQADFQEKMNNGSFEEPAENTKKKTKKQLQKEEAQQQEEKEKLKSIKSIYYSLVKVLHPDTRTSEEDRIQKEEMIKKVTEAYNNKDLPTLLKLEIEWLSESSSHIDELSDKQLKLYNQVLTDQIKELKEELVSLKYNPRYHQMASYLDSSYSPKKLMQFDKDELIQKQLTISIAIENMKRKKDIVEVVSNVEYEAHSSSFDDIFSEFEF